ncbi:MAG: dipeptidase [Pseudomonadota bacterium]
MTDAVLDHAIGRRDALLDDLATFVAQPSVGADPAYGDGMEGARRFLETRLAEAGFGGLRRLTPPDGSGEPAIYAEWLGAKDAPTLMIYGHYDVQPPDPLEHWQSPPFEATIRDGRLYGRGVSDDKGPMLIALEALIAFLRVEGRLPVNVRLLLEGEEETGSPSLAPILAAHRDLLQADAVLSADGARWRADLTTINVGNRGNGGFEITVRTAAKDLHSGRYGGVVPNALHVLADLVSGLRDRDGRIVVEGFFDGVDDPSSEERAAIAAIPFDEAALLTDLGTAAAGEPGFGFLERLWLRPTLEVNGMWGGYTGTGGKTVIPNTAHAKLTMRLVPGQNPDQVRGAVLRHLRARCPAGATLTVSDERGWAAAYDVPAAHPLLLAAEDALEETTADRPIRVRIGATLPLTELVQSTLGLDTVMFSFSTADEDFHAPNEFLRLSAIDEGLAAWIALLRRVGRQTPADYAAYRP